ncbi:hypothetical protein A7982_13075 [Minicystis rosea]|nr:hypothetical protein A7982_13075 [Minicystis rosea]
MSHEHVIARRLLSGMVMVGVAALAMNAAAQAPDKAAADALFKDGRVAFDKGDFATACPKFAASLKADPAPGTLLNLAVCESRLGQLTSARSHLKELVSRLPPKDDRLAFALDLIQKLEARLPQITLTLAPGAPPDTVVKLSGGAPLALGAVTLLDPGEHDLVITAADRQDAQLHLKLAEGQRETLTVAPGAAKTAAVSAPPPPPAVNEGARLRRTLGIAAGGLGVAGLGIAAVSGGLLVGMKSDLDAHCPNKRCDAEGLRLYDKAKSTPLLPLNTAGWIIGIAGIGAGAVLIATSFGKSADKQTGMRLVPTPLVLPNGGGAALAGSF